ncbi:MAG: hypothetical protein H6993_09475 [Pseudomonadales bacterium]|nr:hypothetical protein [Pseudomonadales bacterium]MCP5184181.1 hypothetical protein [Pseudomonadales bacterium]
MNDPQRDAFLWSWSRRRAIGRGKFGLYGVALGALGGFLFAWFLSPGPGERSAHAYDTLGQLMPDFSLYGMAMAAFGAMGWSAADRLFRHQDRVFQGLLDLGATVPEEKPDTPINGPQIAVYAALLIIALLVVGLFVAFG